jgi:hypothetical protein
MKYEVKPMTMTALAHCRTRVPSWSGRAIAAEKGIVQTVCKDYVYKEVEQIYPSIANQRGVQRRLLNKCIDGEDIKARDQLP